MIVILPNTLIKGQEYSILIALSKLSKQKSVEKNDEVRFS